MDTQPRRQAGRQMHFNKDLSDRSPLASLLGWLSPLCSSLPGLLLHCVHLGSPCLQLHTPLITITHGYYRQYKQMTNLRAQESNEGLISSFSYLSLGVYCSLPPLFQRPRQWSTASIKAHARQLDWTDTLNKAVIAFHCLSVKYHR